MVKILASGEIVQDNDPRAQGTNRGSASGEQRRQGGIRHEDFAQQQQQMGGAGSMFEQLNQRLLQAGLPRFNLGGHTIEPIVTVGFLIAFLLLGVKGLLFGAVLFAVSRWSSSGPGPGGTTGAAGGQQGPGGGGNWAGRGHRLDR